MARDPSKIDVVAYVVISIDEDRDAARNACRRLIASYGPRTHRWVEGGVVEAQHLEPVIAAYYEGGLDAAEAVVSDELVDRVAVAGRPAEVAERLSSLAAAGAWEPPARASSADRTISYSPTYPRSGFRRRKHIFGTKGTSCGRAWQEIWRTRQ